MENSEVGPAEDVLKAFMETLVGPMLPKVVTNDPPSEDNQESVAKQGTTNDDGAEGNVGNRRVLRSNYARLKNQIIDEIDDIFSVQSEKFKSMIEEADNLFNQVQKPREQVADAETLFDIANALVTSVKACNGEGVTPADFVNCLLRDFGQDGGSSSRQNEAGSLIRWKDIGQAVSRVFMVAPGCSTMVGPMSLAGLKQRQINAVHRKGSKPTENHSRPEELLRTNEEKTDTDNNMATMFSILKNKRKANFENLILNRKSFAQTAENLFALSFLIKDGRAAVTVDKAGRHIVSPKNAPGHEEVLSGDVTFTHFIFRFDFSDWQLMLDSVAVGEELMPHRVDVDNMNNAEEALSSPLTPMSSNHGLVMQEQTTHRASSSIVYRRRPKTNFILS